MDRLRAFEVFSAVAARGSFTKAADALDTSPANVTRYVNELEAHLGTRLLNRSSRRLSLTEGGAALFEKLRGILDDVTEAEALATASSVTPKGRLRINAPVSFGILHLAPLWPGFLVKYPEVELDVVLSDRVVDIVEEGYDLAVRISRGGATSLVARRLAASRNVAVASPDYLKRHGVLSTPADLAGHRCIGYSYNVTAEDWHFFDAAGQPVVQKVRFGFHTNNGDTARSAALGGIGITWQPTFIIGQDLKAGRLVPVLPEYRMADIDILAAYPSRRHLSAKVRMMVDYLAQSFTGVPVWDR
ncbi:LysR substrate-binding domain-containing protein [Lacibacterium aquatile]|uniref:LysR substrate-binding domain-containing protein n=1 Tax=Lacibacterium aquatile TaxID=1168082 RepID=A0ABW5DVL8_9PROT